MIRDPRLLILWAAPVFLLGIAVGMVIASVGVGIGAPPAQPASTPRGTPAVASAEPIPPDELRTGTLVFDARIDGSGGEFTAPSISGDPASVEIQHAPGVIQMKVLSDSGGIAATFTRRSFVFPFIAEVGFRVDASSDITFAFNAHEQNGQRLVTRVYTQQQEMELVYADLTTQPATSTSLTPRVRIPDLLTGRRVVIAVLAAPPAYALYLDSQLVARGSNDPLPGLLSPIGLSVLGRGGGVRVSTLRAYALQRAS